MAGKPVESFRKGGRVLDVNEGLLFSAEQQVPTVRVSHLSGPPCIPAGSLKVRKHRGLCLWRGASELKFPLTVRKPTDHPAPSSLLSQSFSHLGDFVL